MKGRSPRSVLASNALYRGTDWSSTVRTICLASCCMQEINGMTQECSIHSRFMGRDGAPTHSNLPPPPKPGQSPKAFDGLGQHTGGQLHQQGGMATTGSSPEPQPSTVMEPHLPAFMGKPERSFPWPDDHTHRTPGEPGLQPHQSQIPGYSSGRPGLRSSAVDKQPASFSCKSHMVNSVQPHRSTGFCHNCSARLGL